MIERWAGNLADWTLRYLMPKEVRATLFWRDWNQFTERTGPVRDIGDVRARKEVLDILWDHWRLPSRSK